MLDSILKGAGALVDAGVNWLWGEKQEDMQAKFARNAIQWKVKDAQKAGVHPLYALGAPTMNYSPVSVGGMSNFADAGQDIGRAIGAGMPREGQAAALTGFDEAVQSKTLTKFDLENELLKGQIMLMNQQLLSKPALPGGPHRMPGQASSGPAPAPEFEALRTPFGELKTSPFISDAQHWENRYGEMADWLSGPLIAFQDYLHTIAPSALRYAVRGRADYARSKRKYQESIRRSQTGRR